jgi:uncharacterized membrane protein
MYQASVAAHVAAAVVGFGATFSYPVIQVVAERRDPRALPTALASILAISRWIAVPATLVVGATGAYQVASGPYDLGDAWLVAGIALYLAVMLVAVGYLAPRYRRAERAARAIVDAGSVDPSPEYRAATRGVNVVGPVVAAAVLAIVVLMELKPA